VYTVGPATLRGLIRQRVRWIRGFLENAWDYRDMFFKKKYGHFGLFTLPVATIFVFYVLYAISYTVIKFIINTYNNLESYLALGIHIPNFEFDIFYITTDVFAFQSIFLLTVLAFVLMVSRTITNDKQPLFKNFPVYFLLYPFVAPVFIFIAVYKFIFKSENKWVLQDNKA
jgi:cellulose synthase/poly-beta-1,6-N-acetylglucosamine synthase-like glycosyltransferase